MVADCSVAGGGEWLLSVSGKYGSLRCFITSEGDSISCFASQNQSGDHEGQAPFDSYTQQSAF